MTINRSKLMKRAWYLSKTFSFPIAYAMKKVWKEIKDEAEKLIAKAEAKKEADMLKTWWSTTEYKEIERIENNTYKRFAADENY